MYDTISWYREDGIETIDNGEALVILDWSADGRFLLAAGGTECKVIDTTTWQTSHTIDCLEKKRISGYDYTAINSGQNNSPENPQNPSSCKTNNTSHFENEYSEQTRIPILAQFERMSQNIHTFFKDKNPPEIILGFMSCVQMLYEHVQWFKSSKVEVYTKLIEKDDGQLLLSVLEVLTRATRIMERIVKNYLSVADWWHSEKIFSLTARRMRRIKAWNDLCVKEHAQSPVIDIELLISS